ncbi:MAG TPA: DUF1036 domain-containing protein [Rhizomicrobium sp.]|nr:DUF1036 domain-containing protein [Rhizomicrobium sp.]
MIFPRRPGGLAAILLLFAFATPAEAGLKLCNRTSYVLYAATGYLKGVNAITQGWFRMLPGTCQTAIKEPLTAHGYFVYARTSLAHSGLSRAWGGAQKLCVKDANFGLSTPLAARCPSDDTFELPFAGIDTKRQTSWAMTFDDSPAFATLQDAERAGLKRLLKDQGAKIGAIDAKPDKAADAAMAAFRKRLNMNPKASTSDLFDALETEALKSTAPAGYAICNDTAKAIWAALALNNAGKWTSRGWWKIAAGGCAKAITDALKTDKVFLLAQTPGGVPIVYGVDKFCTTNVEFEIQGRENCKSRGLVEAGFATTNVKGLSGFTAHVSEHGLVYMPKVYSGTPK